MGVVTMEVVGSCAPHRPGEAQVMPKVEHKKPGEQSPINMEQRAAIVQHTKTHYNEMSRQGKHTVIY